MTTGQQDTDARSTPAPSPCPHATRSSRFGRRGRTDDGGSTRSEARTSVLSRRSYRWAHIVLILVAVMVGGTGLAQASFSGSTKAPVTVGTYDIPASASLAGTYSCDSQRRILTVNISGFGRVDKATAYTLSLAEPGTNPATTTQNLTANQTTTTITRATTRTGAFTLRLTARVGTWTSDTPLIRTITC